MLRLTYRCSSACVLFLAACQPASRKVSHLGLFISTRLRPATSRRQVYTFRTLHSRVAAWQRMPAQQSSASALVKAVLVARFPQLAREGQEDLADWLSQDVLLPETPLCWDSPDALQQLLGECLLDWGYCDSELEAALACEDLSDSYQNPGESVSRMVAALQDGVPSLQAALEAATEEQNDEQAPPGICELCGREMPLTEHHLYPRETHKKFLKRGLMTEADRLRKVKLCRQCHNKVHKTFPNEELATNYNRLTDIAQHEAIQRWVAFAIKQKPRNLTHGMKLAR